MSCNLLEQLNATAPDLLAQICDQGYSDPAKWPAQRREDLAKEALWALSQGAALANFYTLGLVRLEPCAPWDRINLYKETVRTAIKTGLTLAQIMAEHFWPVLLWGQNGVIEQFQQSVETLLSKGTYTLKPPLECLSWLLKNGQIRAAQAFLTLLQAAFSKEMTYNLSLKFSYLLPQSARAFDFSKNHFQIEQLTRVVEVDFVLAERFLLGLQNGLERLDSAALEQFVTTGLEKYGQNVVSGRKFLSLTSQAARNAQENLRVSVALARIRPMLERTIRVRVGYFVPIVPLGHIEAHLPCDQFPLIYVLSDGKQIYLREEISDFSRKSDNEMLYKLLAKLESIALEFKTFEFDLDRYHDVFQPDLILDRESELTDFETFYNGFELPQLAEDLFNIIEQGRLRYCLEENYKGLARIALTFLRNQAAAITDTASKHFLTPLYNALALGRAGQKEGHWFDSVLKGCEKLLLGGASVEMSAHLTRRFYDFVAQHRNEKIKDHSSGYKPFYPLYGRKIQPGLLKLVGSVHHKEACRIRKKLLAQGVTVYVSDVRKELMRKNGSLSKEELTRIIVTSKPLASTETETESCLDLSNLDLNAVLEAFKHATHHVQEVEGNVRRYKEWDCRVSDYINDHARVVDQVVATGGQNRFYARTLDGRAGLVARMRKAFEILKPEGLVLLRQWVEGDDFDYRALVDFALDRRAGLMPSDRLYIKRLKQNRDVTVLLLVDVSRSTANFVAGTTSSVLCVQKEAIVLFCEALNVVGDEFAIAGFSGSGRLNVDYFRLKEFDEPVNEPVKERIGAIAPQRSTRMGAAIRHAASDLAKRGRKVRLLLILSDGFPNDADYKGEYAVADTRTAILEARAKNIVVKAITVNMGADARLNDLYGSAHHQVIEDVRDLPDQLLRMYGKLTRL